MKDEKEKSYSDQRSERQQDETKGCMISLTAEALIL
jgi:hypothetical protein